MKKLLVIVVVCAVFGTIGLYLYSAMLETMEYPIGALTQADIGKFVAVTGTVKSTFHMHSGDLGLVLIDTQTGATITVFIPRTVWTRLNATDFLPGTVLKIRGELIGYKGSLALTPGACTDIMRVRQAAENNVELFELLRAPEIYRNMLIRTNGTISNLRIIENMRTFKVVDSSDRSKQFWIRVEKNITYEKRVPGDHILVYGNLVYNYTANRGNGRWELVIEKNNDTVVHVSERAEYSVEGYEPVTLSALIIEPEKYKSRKLAVKGLIVTQPSELIGTFFMLRETKSRYAVNCVIFGKKIITDINGNRLSNEARVLFTATFDYYAPLGQWQLWSETNTLIRTI